MRGAVTYPSVAERQPSAQTPIPVRRFATTTDVTPSGLPDHVRKELARKQP